MKINKLYNFIYSLMLMLLGMPYAFADNGSVTAPNIDMNGRLVLPSPMSMHKLPTKEERFFKKNNAYQFGATLHIQDVGLADKTKGYTIYSRRAYNEIESVLGHTPKWGDWAKSIQAQINKNSSIEIAGQLTRNGIQVKGDYLGHAEFRVIGAHSHDSTKKAAFSAILPEINQRNQFINQLDGLGHLSPSERSKLVDGYVYQNTQPKPNEHRAPYIFNPRYRQYATDGEYWGKEAEYTNCVFYTHYRPNGHKVCSSTPMGVGDYAKYGLEDARKALNTHFDEVWQETNRKARQNLEQTGVDAPPGFNFVGWGSYHLNAFVGALTTVPDVAIRTVGADKAAGYIYDKYAPDDTKAIVSDMATSYANFAESNPNTNEITQLGINFIPTTRPVKTFLPKKAGRGHDDFAGAINHNIPLTEEYFRQQYGAGNVVQGGGKRLENLERFDKNQQINQKSNFKNYTNADNVLRIEHDSKLTTTVDGNLSVTHGLGYDAKKELDGIRAFLLDNQQKVKAFNENRKVGEKEQNSLISAGSNLNTNVSISTATITNKDGTATHLLAFSGKSWSGHAPDKFTYNGKEYQVIRDETYNLGINGNKEKVLEDKSNPKSNQSNSNHAEKKLMSYITQQNKNGSISDVKINIQNTSPDNPGACYACGGKNGTGGTIQDFKNLNQNVNIHIEHGSTGTTP